MDPDVLELLQAAFTQGRILVSLAALSLYEYLITVDQEVELVWRRKTRFSLPSILLVSTRVCMVVTAVLTLTPSTACTGFKVIDILLQVLDIIGFIQVALFSALRVSALYNRSIPLFAIVLVFGLVPVGTNIIKFVRTTYIPQPDGCYTDSNISDALTRKLVLITRIPVIAADFLVLALTLAKTYEQILLTRNMKISTSLSTCLARDGALYFLVLLTLNILQLATYRTRASGPVSYIVSILPPILINRFMLNLRQAGSGPNPSDPVTLEHLVVSTPRFQLSEHVVGSMGEPLEHGGLAIPDEEDGEADAESTEVDGHSLQYEERRRAQERSADATGSGVVSV